MLIKVVLTGPKAGKTVLLNGKQFVNGELVISFSNPTEREFQLRYLARVCRAYPAGSPELVAAQSKDKERGIQCEVHPASGQRNPEAVLGGTTSAAGDIPEVRPLPGSGVGSELSPVGDEGVGAGGSGQENSGLHPEQIGAIRKAVRALDPLVEANWTQGGLPTVEAVCVALQDKGITRAMISAVEPEFNREMALQIAAEGEI